MNAASATHCDETQHAALSVKPAAVIKPSRTHSLRRRNYKQKERKKCGQVRVFFSSQKDFSFHALGQNNCCIWPQIMSDTSSLRKNILLLTRVFSLPKINKSSSYLEIKDFWSSQPRRNKQQHNQSDWNLLSCPVGDKGNYRKDDFSDLPGGLRESPPKQWILTGREKGLYDVNIIWLCDKLIKSWSSYVEV